MASLKKKILIIGGMGFIGSHLSEALFWLGHKVIIIDNFSTSTVKRNKKSFEIYKIDIENINKVRDIFKKEKPDIVYHLAGAIDLRRQITDPLFIKSLNILERTNIILDLCLENKVKNIIFISSGGALYYNAKIVPTPEDYKSHPESLYGIANLMIEKYITLYHKEYGLNYTILRLPNVYGPGQWKSGVIPSLIINILKGERPVIYGDGEQTRDFIYISDVIQAFIKMTDNKTEKIYNVGSGKEIKLNTILDLILKMTDKKIKPIYRKLAEEESRRNVLDIRKIKKEINWSPRIGLKQGLKETLIWFLEKSI